MSLKDDIEFRKKLESSKNIYADIRNVVTSARELSLKYDNKILHSEAITHVIHGTEPDLHVYVDCGDEYEAHQIKELFCYIDNKEICDAVYDSFYASKSKNNLIFLYNNINEPNKQARVRVLTRMLWYKLIK